MHVKLILCVIDKDNSFFSFSEVTTQYGYINFDEDDLDSTVRLPEYIRLALQTNPTTVVKFMQYGWGLPMPDLIISVTGGGKQCNMSAHLRKTFQHGLAVAAATTSKTQFFLDEFNYTTFFLLKKLFTYLCNRIFSSFLLFHKFQSMS